MSTIPSSASQEIEILERSFSSLNLTIDRVNNFPSKVRYDVMVPIGKVAFCPGQLIHTNEFKVLERNQTEKDLSNLDVISYKDTSAILNARADDLQKRLSQIKQKYGIKEEVVVSKSVTPTQQTSTHMTSTPAPLPSPSVTSTSSIENAKKNEKRPMGESVMEKEPSTPKPLKSALKGGISSSNKAAKVDIQPVVAPTSSSDKDNHNDINKASHVSFNAVVTSDQKDEQPVKDLSKLSSSSSSSISNPIVQATNNTAVQENIFEIREYLDSETVTHHELIDITKQLAYMENQLLEKPSSLEEDNNDEKKEELNLLDDPHSNTGIISNNEEDDFIRELSTISDRIAATKKRPSPTTITSCKTTSSKDDLEDIFAMLEHAQGKRDVVEQENVAASKTITGTGWKTGFFGNNNNKEKKKPSSVAKPATTATLPSPPLASSATVAAAHVVGIGANNSNGNNGVSKTPIRGPVTATNQYHHTLSTTTTTATEETERKKGALLASLGMDTIVPKKQMKMVDTTTTTNTTNNMMPAFNTVSGNVMERYVDAMNATGPAAAVNTSSTPLVVKEEGKRKAFSGKVMERFP